MGYEVGLLNFVRRSLEVLLPELTPIRYSSSIAGVGKDQLSYESCVKDIRPHGVLELSPGESIGAEGHHTEL